MKFPGQVPLRPTKYEEAQQLPMQDEYHSTELKPILEISSIKT